MPDEYPPYPGPEQPPDDDLATDPWGWLYRDEPSESSPRGSGEPQPTQPMSRGDIGNDDPEAPHPTFVAPGPAWQETPAEPDATRPYGPTAGVGDATAALGPDEQQPQRRRKGGLLAAVVLGALVLVGVLIVVLVLVFRSFGGPPGTMPYQGQATSPTQSSSQRSSEKPSGAPTYDGNVAPIAATGASAKCVAPDAKDGAGNTVSYAPGNVADDDPATAWRCDGDAKDQSITIDLPKDSTVARVGLINGYAKVDPKSNAQRYGEYRRVTKVRWTFSNGATFDQDLSDGVQAVQHLNIPVQKGVDEVRLTILASTDPGQDDPTRDAVLISTVQIGKPA